MTQAQRIIKYLAIALALCLVGAIFAGIVAGITLLVRLTDGHEEVVGDSTAWSVTEAVDKLDIEIAAAELIIREGESFRVETDNGYITFSQKNGTLTLREKSHGWWGNNDGGTVVIELPRGQVFETVEIDAGAGKMSVDGLTATRSADIDGGAGEIRLTNSALHNLDLDLGVGALTLKAAVTGDSAIDFGVGEAKLTLTGAAEDYTVRMDKGLGSATLDGTEMKSGKKYGDGENRLELDGGIGSVSINFTDSSAE